MNSALRDVIVTVKNWWAYEFLGALLVIVSILVFSFPLSSYAGLVVYFAVSFLLSGIMRITFALTNKTSLENWQLYLTGGVVDLMVGVFLLTRLDVSAVALPYYVGFFLTIGSISAIAKAIDLRTLGVGGQGWLLLAGFLSLLLALIIFINPILGAVTITISTGLGFAMLGIFYMILGFRLRNVQTIAKHYFINYKAH